MKQQFKALLYKVAPRLMTAAMSARARAHSHSYVAGCGSGVLARKLVAKYGNRVNGGPFDGLTLSPMTHAEQIGPYLLGFYESELDEAWETVFRGAFTQIIDVGAKFGYYAVGLARKFPDADVVAFDTGWWARRAVREMAAANQTPKVQVRGYCTAEWMVRNAHESSFIISDCEGYEAELFTPEVISQLKSAALIIETHDCFVPGVCEKLTRAFRETHTVWKYGEGSTKRSSSVPLEFLTETEQQLAVNEMRPAQDWLLCLPKLGPNCGLIPGSHKSPE